MTLTYHLHSVVSLPGIVLHKAAHTVCYACAAGFLSCALVEQSCLQHVCMFCSSTVSPQ